MGDLQDPKMEVLYHLLGHIFWGYSLDSMSKFMETTDCEVIP